MVGHVLHRILPVNPGVVTGLNHTQSPPPGQPNEVCCPSIYEGTPPFTKRIAPMLNISSHKFCFVYRGRCLGLKTGLRIAKSCRCATGVNFSPSPSRLSMQLNSLRPEQSQRLGENRSFRLCSRRSANRHFSFPVPCSERKFASSGRLRSRFSARAC